jgi:putative redox protein
VNEKRVTVQHESGMRLVARTGSGHSVEFDDGEDDTGPRPTEVVLAALAACSAMDVLSVALKKRQNVVAYRVEVRAVQRDEYPQVFTEIDLVHVVEGDAVETKAIRRCIELSATRYCPVSAMLSAGATAIHHRYRIVRTGAEPEEGEVQVTGPYQRPDIVS